ncbi:putative signaling protein [Abditibacteriota bacterium]|nr:putative signaling protein [Abditibacteriota bacterium]
MTVASFTTAPQSHAPMPLPAPPIMSFSSPALPLVAPQTPRIFVVEDEMIISKDIQRTLLSLGYDIAGHAVSSQSAIERARESKPDLVLMDINIKGDRDGIETAAIIGEELKVPIVYLTAFADAATIERAKHTMPFGYLLKPFEERELQTAIEMALYKHRAETELARTQALITATLNSVGEGVLAADEQGRITFLNPVAQTLTGWSIEEAVGSDWHEVFQLEREDQIERVLPPGARVGGVRARMLRARDGKIRPVEMHMTPLRSAEGEPVGLVLTFRDVTERRALEERLVHQAFHDPLTALPNRALLTSRLLHALNQNLRMSRNERRERNSNDDGNSCVAVLFLDMDNFKVVNDSLGHAAGDAMLIEIAARLERCLRAGDTAARFGGDEFVILIDDVNNPRYATQIAERIVAALQEPFDVGGQKVYSSPSIGVAFAARGNETAEDLLRDADAAMYDAKKRGKACYSVFQNSLSFAARARLDIGNELRLALERNEFVLHYQPKVELSTGHIYGVEALVRWDHPTRGLLSPAEFIGVAEEMGLIVPLGRWILREACTQARCWQQQELSSHLSMSVNVSARQLSDSPGGIPMTQPVPGGNIDMNINVSARQLQHPDLVREVAQILRDTGLNPHNLVLEITESVLMDEADSSMTVLEELKDLGVRLAIDDFGTGYSSLAYLRVFPVDFLKIDRQFVRGAGQSESGEIILNSMIDLAHALKLTVVAEGAETAEEVVELRKLGCDLAQGYFFARPLAPEDVSALLAINTPPQTS